MTTMVATSGELNPDGVPATPAFSNENWPRVGSYAGRTVTIAFATTAA